VDHVIRRVVGAAKAGRTGFLAALAQFVGFPSVSADPRCASQVRACASWLAGHLADAGLEEVEVVQTGGHPVVLAAWRGMPGLPTLLVYGHYDVQPAGALAAWHSPPFEARVQGEHLYGRGASDDKGQLLAWVAALHAWLIAQDELPVNVVCLFDGEEEIGSPNLRPVLQARRQGLAADAGAVSDTRMLGPMRPVITYGLRGSLRAHVEVEGPAVDLHSGTFGGAVDNPLQVIAKMVAGLHDSRGHVRVAGFYDRVRAVPAAERMALARDGPSDREILRVAGVDRASGEPGFTLYERTTIRPVLAVNSIAGGHRGPGGSAVIPARACAMLEARLVPDQEPSAVARSLERHLEHAAPTTTKARVRISGMSRAVLVDRCHPAVHAAELAYRRAFGVPAVLLRSGGTIAPVSLLTDVLGLPMVLMGFALPTDQLHAPNERVHLPTLSRGVDTCIWFLANMAQLVEPVTVPTRVSPSAPRSYRLRQGRSTLQRRQE
jgi:acetylornithine deacetylase/succinyl-diaminopimelate desuccinylase-like protein